MTLFKWSTTAASNDTADSTINLREGMAPSAVNDSNRAMMAAIAKWRDDQSGNLVTGGTSTAYTLTTNQGYTALTDGISVTCRMSATSGAAPTLNVDSLGAKAIASVYGTAVLTAALKSGGIYTFTYDSTDDKWILRGNPVRDVPSGSVMLFYSAAAPVGWTVSNADNDKDIRIVSGSSGNGGAASGTTAYSTIFAARTIAQANLPNVTLAVTGSAAAGGAHGHAFRVARGNGASSDAAGGGFLMDNDATQETQVAFTTTTPTSTLGQQIGGAADHTHTVSATSASINGGVSQTTIDFAVQYISVIKASKD